MAMLSFEVFRIFSDLLYLLQYGLVVGYGGLMDDCCCCSHILPIEPFLNPACGSLNKGKTKEHNHTPHKNKKIKEIDGHEPKH